jgi:transcriptional regulator with XRE-family HTH domain
MPVNTLPMRKIRDILRLRFEANLSFEKIARALSLSKGVVSKLSNSIENFPANSVQKFPVFKSY